MVWPPEMKIRLNTYLARAGVTSRRKADRLIAQGRVRVNGEVVERLGTLVDDKRDRVEVDGKEIKSEKSFVYLILHKPSGYLVTLNDPFGRPTIKDLLPQIKARVFPVGRLDLDSKGLVLFTNDGNLAHRIMHPRYEVKKVYLVTVVPKPEPSKLAMLEEGIKLDGKKTAPAKINLLGGNERKARLRIEIHEGRKRELKRMFETIGHSVTSLIRVQLGVLHLGSLPEGCWRYLTPEEIDSLKRMVKLK